MIRMLRQLGGARVAFIVGLAMLAAACAKNPMDGAGQALGSAPPGSPQEFIVSVGDRVFFESDQSDLTPQAQATLDKQAQWLQHYAKYTFTIEGHADERGTREYNMALGERRAKAVQRYLVLQGVSPAQLELVSYGEERPAAGSADEQSWAQNRRVELRK